MPDTSTERVRRHRTHKTGDHSNCHFETCLERQKLENDCNATYYIKAVIEELKRRGVEPADFFGHWEETRAQAEREYPDWLVKLTTTIELDDGTIIEDRITPIRARHDVARCLAMVDD